MILISNLSRLHQMKNMQIKLTLPELSDLEEIFDIHRDPATNEFNPAGHLLSKDDMRTKVASWVEDWRLYGIGYWTIKTEETDEILGIGGVRHAVVEGREILNVYYRLSPRAWGKGIATSVAKQGLEQANRMYPNLPVVAIVAQANQPSQTVASKIGLTSRGLLPFRDGERLWFTDRPIHNQS
jgi:ribosomal-protein-alanine N-acetyltransferase